MSFIDSDRIYYPEEYDYSIYYQNELEKYKSTPIYAGAPKLNENLKRRLFLPTTVNYFNERKCPIYVHNIKKNSSTFNQYNLGPKKPVEPQKSYDAPKHSKFVLDKLEETYWATWKPKKEPDQRGFPRRMMQNHFYGDHRGDTSENVLFKAKNFDCSSTANSIHEKTFDVKPPEINEERRVERPCHPRKPNQVKNELITQEIQTSVHCPVILEESKSETKPKPDKEPSSVNVEILIDEDSPPEDKTTKKTKKSKTKTNKKKSKPKPSETNQTDTLSKSELDIAAETVNTFVEHKDSIEIIKKKQEAEGPKEHFQQPKCIRLFRKPAVGYIKGGSYPLKPCLKKESAPRGQSFVLGAPGSPMFMTSHSFAGKRKK